MSEDLQLTRAIELVMHTRGVTTKNDGSLKMLHPIAVASILNSIGASHEAQVAAIFHNLLYRDNGVDRDALIDRAGVRVVEIIEEFSGPRPPWIVGKKNLLAQAMNISDEALEVVMADRISDLLNYDFWTTTDGSSQVQKALLSEGKPWLVVGWFHYRLNQVLKVRLKSTPNSSLERLRLIHQRYCQRLWPKLDRKKLDKIEKVDVQRLSRRYPKEIGQKGIDWKSLQKKCGAV